MVVISVARPLDAGVVGEAADTWEHPVEWWYANALLEAPGTPLDGLALVGVFSLFKGVIEEGRHLLISPHAGIFADFGTGPLRPGTISSSCTALDVRNGPNYLRGAYPDLELHLEGQATNGANIEVDLVYSADIAPEREGYIDSQLNHYVVYRSTISGTVAIGGDKYPVHGHGYFEHLFGTLGWLEPYLGDPDPPVFVNGWNWYWSPVAGPEGIVVQAGGIITEGEPLPFVSISVDGATFTQFTTGRFEVLEKRTVEGVAYVHRFRLTDSNAAGSVDLTFTRRDAAQRAVKQAPGGNKVVFVTGFAELEGSVTLGDRDYDVAGRALGSVFTVSLAPWMVAVRRWPAAIRVPLGRILRGAQLLASKVR
ncbi:hypothetical protein [Nocardia gamkensis]|uniref:Uncharacterized protein n=1 Tax=Nocardia gamkensis TaxID=352869 RepID=A0A7X6LAE7_9NOCA|nr:hypothetical protein [Nocardia gamkensis]NKY30574.1 hypothetical protein [Nocardia gamkensis]NQE70556.1 hypothetical protein [Nocardia gamkensis]